MEINVNVIIEYLPLGNLARALMGVLQNQKLVARYTGVPLKFIQGKKYKKRSLVESPFKLKTK